jgi:hypothetical protein
VIQLNKEIFIYTEWKPQKRIEEKKRREERMNSSIMLRDYCFSTSVAVYGVIQ